MFISGDKEKDFFDKKYILMITFLMRQHKIQHNNENSHQANNHYLPKWRETQSIQLK